MQEQFFSVTRTTPVNVLPMPADCRLPTLEALDAELPGPFRIASIDKMGSRLLRNRNEPMHDLVEIINRQSRKIDTIMGHVLVVQDHPEHRCHTLRFGAGPLICLPPRQGHGEVPHRHQIVRLTSDCPPQDLPAGRGRRGQTAGAGRTSRARGARLCAHPRG